MLDRLLSRTRYGEAFWRAHHEESAGYCEAQGIRLKAFGNWRAKFKAEPQPPERKLLYRRAQCVSSDELRRDWRHSCFATCDVAQSPRWAIRVIALLVESAWTHRFSPRIGAAKLRKLERVSPRGQRDRLEDAVAAQCPVPDFVRARQNTTIPCTAVAHELTEFIWAVTKEAEQTQRADRAQRIKNLASNFMLASVVPVRRRWAPVLGA